MLNQLRKIRNSYLSGQRKKKQAQNYYRLVGQHILEDESANELISQLILEKKPAFITRFGSSELATLIHFMHARSVEGTKTPWNEHHKQILCDVSGFFPFTQDSMDRFSQAYLSFLSNIDVLAVWNVGEENVAHLLPKDIKLVNLPAIEPYYFAKPWSRSLAGKKVLVIHPFAETIRRQYNNRLKIFENIEVLPLFDLDILPAVQSVADNTQGFTDWFAALDAMCESIAAIEFDVAIIGAGAYGMPLANFVKMTKGKVAIHMGGATQVLFGIKGKRWEDVPSVRSLFNEFWVNPSASERPDGLEKVEGGSYW